MCWRLEIGFHSKRYGRYRVSGGGGGGGGWGWCDMMGLLMGMALGLGAVVEDDCTLVDSRVAF